VSGSALQALAEALGILPEWHDLAGTLQVTQPDTQRALLAAMGLPVGSEAEAAEALAARAAEAAARRLPEEVVVIAGEALRLPLAPANGSGTWRLELEDGTRRDGRAEAEIVITPPAGLHRLAVGDESSLVIAAPAEAPGVGAVLGKPRAWGITAALYGLRSPRNLGLGDYTDLAAAAAGLAGLGADFLGINPVHARGAACPGISPYTPSCRTAFEPRHIAVDAVPGFADSPRVRALLGAEAEPLAAARAGALVDYAAAEAVSAQALRALFADFEQRGGAAAADFAAWRQGDGRALEWFALFEALSLSHGADWRSWPEALRHPDSPAVRDFAAAKPAEVRYHSWLQWLAAGQLAAAQQRARDAGMGLGLYLDVAVGVRPGGADSWAAPDCFAEGVSLGAPPDAFNPAGQNWCLAPFNPVGLRRAAYHPFVQMLRTAMRHAGIIRIDHILGVKRSFWVPADGAPGGYVAYPQEALLALIRLEAWRAGCVVVGEDLGSVPPGLRDRLAEAGLLGCAVVQFEKEHHRFRPTREYRPATLASFGTHDTPTLRGWWSGWDIDRRHDIGGNDAAARAAGHEARAAERRCLAQLLQDEGLAPEGFDPAAPPAELDDSVAAALHRLLARAGSALVAVQLDDALGRVEQQNLPGTIDEYPNWRRRYAVAVDALAAHAGLRAIAAIFSPPESPTPSPQETRPWQ
jgi:4-alpha-glucanotransferase